MTGTGHRLFGVGIAAITAYTVVVDNFGFIPAVIFVLASVPGATAPDWLEIRIFGRPLIPHRTITHWLWLWLALFLFGLGFLGVYPIPELVYSYSHLWVGAFICGFSIGAISHWLGDLGTPMGVPFLNPFKRVSLRLWKTGYSEVLPVSLVWAITAIMLFGFDSISRFLGGLVA